MINVTANYAAQTFLSPATTQIQTQVNNANSANTPISFPRVFSRTSFAGTAPDGSLAVMYQYDGMVNPNALYAYQSIGEAQNRVLEAAAAKGNEYYIEISPLQVNYYSILTWASNI